MADGIPQSGEAPAAGWTPSLYTRDGTLNQQHYMPSVTLYCTVNVPHGSLVYSLGLYGKDYAYDPYYSSHITARLMRGYYSASTVDTIASVVTTQTALLPTPYLNRWGSSFTGVQVDNNNERWLVVIDVPTVNYSGMQIHWLFNIEIAYN